MTLAECLSIGKECGLTTWEECYDNINYHAGMIFAYEDVNKEMLELQKDMFRTNPDKFCKIFNATRQELVDRGWDDGFNN